MTRMSPLVDHCLELFAPLGRVSARRMFGGWGFRVDGELFFALVIAERLYLKADESTRERFAAAGGEAFSYERPQSGRVISVDYWSVPAEALESPALMQPWARLALQAAVAARSSARPRKATSAAAKTQPPPPVSPKKPPAPTQPPPAQAKKPPARRRRPPPGGA